MRRHLSAGQVSDCRGAEPILSALPAAEVMIADTGDDRKRWGPVLAPRGIASCLPGRASRTEPIVSDAALDKRRPLIERLLSRLKDWRRIATRYDRCAHPFDRAICLAARLSSGDES